MSEDLKTKGNEALKNGKIEAAIKFYTEGLAIDPKSHVLYSNRSAAYCKSGQYSEALQDAEKCISLKSDWPKGYSRKAAALEYLERNDEALKTYEEALKIDPNNDQFKKGIDNLQSSNLGSGDRNTFSLSSLFTDPGFLQKIESNPKTKEYMNDPGFKAKLELMKKDPKMMSLMLQDKQMMDVIAVGLGVDPGNIEVKSQDEPERSYSPKKKEEPKVEKMEVDLNDEEKMALNEKDKGNEAYKAKKFTEAIEHYTKATELDPKNCTFYTNKAAVYFEMKDYSKTIELCEKAVEIGRENRADYKLIAKAYARCANAYVKLNDLKNAKKFYDKSLSEHRVQEIVKKSQEVERQIKEQEKLAYVDPEKAEKEKQLGNTEFQKGRYPEAMKHYNEAIKRNPDDPKIYSNRAACYSKLMEFSMALKDCEKCIQLDPTFVKGYLRKATCHLSLKDTTKASEAYSKALELDPNCEEAKQGLRKIPYMESDPEEMRKRALQDPEIQQILSDPAMQVILNQMQKEPEALREHLQDPHVAANLKKLMDKGFISIR